MVRRDTASRARSWLLALLGTTLVLNAPGVLAVEVGEPAPDFTLPSTSGPPIRLSQFQGNKHVLLQFYSMDFNPT